jgi:hypothetical protein
MQTTYPVEKYDQLKYSKVIHHSGGYYAMPVHENAEGKEVLFKSSGYDKFWALSEVFHSRLAKLLGQPTVENNLAKTSTLDPDSYKKEGISSVLAVAPNETFASCGRFFGDEEQIQNIQLSYAFRECPAEFRNGFMANWLTQNFFANIDQQSCHNIAYIKTEGEPRHLNPIPQRIAPNFDYEQCLAFLDDDSDCHNFTKGINPDNMNYLKANHRKTLDLFMDKITSLNKNAEFDKLCEFDGADLYYGRNKRTQKKLTTLGNTVRDFYKKRANLFASNYKTDSTRQGVSI